MMGTLYDYLDWRGDLSFEQAPLCDVDALIFALLSYIDFGDTVSDLQNSTPVSLQAVANTYFARNPDIRKVSLGLIVPKDIVKLFRAVKECKRYRNVGVRGYVNKIDLGEQTQFSAVTFLPGDGTAVATYRGTDDTIVGWKENFNMSFLQTVPAQAYAAEYLNQVADHHRGKIYVTGHSKGGNLSVYAAVRCRADVRKRLISVWNHDGPGFSGGMLNDPDYLDLKPIIRTFVPESSVVGMLLEHDEDYTVVSSRQKGVNQHNGLTWNILGGGFVELRTTSEESKRFDRRMNRFVTDMTNEQREQLCDALYKVLSSDNALTLTDLMNPKNRWMIRSMKLDPTVGKILSQTLKLLINDNAKSFVSDLLPKK